MTDNDLHGINKQPRRHCSVCSVWGIHVYANPSWKRLVKNSITNPTDVLMGSNCFTWQKHNHFLRYVWYRVVVDCLQHNALMWADCRYLVTLQRFPDEWKSLCLNLCNWCCWYVSTGCVNRVLATGIRLLRSTVESSQNRIYWSHQRHFCDVLL